MKLHITFQSLKVEGQRIAHCDLSLEALLALGEWLTAHSEHVQHRAFDETIDAQTSELLYFTSYFYVARSKFEELAHELVGRLGAKGCNPQPYQPRPPVTVTV